LVHVIYSRVSSQCSHAIHTNDVNCHVFFSQHLIVLFEGWYPVVPGHPQTAADRITWHREAE